MPRTLVHVLIGKQLTMLLSTLLGVRKNLSLDAHSGPLIVKLTAPPEVDGQVSLLTHSDKMDTTQETFLIKNLQNKKIN